MKILITGCRGFVGASVGHFALAAGHQVLGISRSSQPESDWVGQHLQADAAQDDLAGVIGEFNPDLLLQAAGSASVGASITDPTADFRATAVTFMNVLESVRRSGRQPLVVFPSSAAVYGNPTSLPIHELTPLLPISPYGFHKAACETFAHEYSTCFGVGIAVCRLFSLYGRRQRRLLVWEIYQQLAGPAETVELQGTGTETRDFLHVDDLSRAILGLREAAPRGICTTVNIASGIETLVLQLAEMLRALVAPEKDLHCRGRVRPGDPVRWAADTRRLRALLPDWQPQHLDTALAAVQRQWQIANID